MKEKPSAQEDGNKKNEERKETTSKQICGLPKSGKPWKINSEKSKLKVGILKESWEAKMKRKDKKKALQNKISQMKQLRKEEKEKERKRIEAKRKRKEINDLKSGVYQEISNTQKVKKWNKKARNQIMKLPKEIFYHKFGSGYQKFI